MAYFLALDGGGTSTRCWVADETRVLARHSCGTVKLMTVGNGTATARLTALMEQTAAAAGISLRHVAHTCMGLAGISMAAVRGWAQVTLEQVVGGTVSLCGDEEIALEAAFQGGPGILVIAGTGSHVVGRCADGMLRSAGGWGPVVGDEGGGAWIGLQALRAAFRERDRGQDPALLHAVQTFWGLETLGQLIAKVNARERPDFAELASCVASCAEAGDPVSGEVLAQAGRELAEQVLLVLAGMPLAAAGPSLRVAFTGSILERVAIVQQTFTETLRNTCPDLLLPVRPVEPLEGALWKARQGSAANMPSR